MLTCAYQPASSKYLYKTDIWKANSPLIRVVKIGNTKVVKFGHDSEPHERTPSTPPLAHSPKKYRIRRLKSLSSSSSDSEQSDNPKSGSSKDGDSEREHKKIVMVGKLPDGVELSLWELQEMATRQQQQIESQHQILVAKEQRLRYLKHQEARTHQVAAENERLRRLKERVEAQELKLRKLRALRGQVDQDKINNGTLTSDLDSIRALFNEKEKELSLAVAKVEELTRQLEELKRNGRTKEAQPPASAALELDKLRRELLFRNKLKEQQNAQLNQQRDALTQRQEEINSIDKRITELQDRLQRKRLLNQQLANQLQYNNNNNNIHNNNNSNSNQMVRQVKSSSGLLSGYQGQRQNVAAVEPFIHVPNAYHQQTGKDLLKQNNTEDIKKSNGFQKPVLKPLLKDHQEEKVEGIKNENNKNKGIFIEGKEDIKSDSLKEDFGKIGGKDGKNKENNGGDYVPEFAAGKSDPKYQTLPYNTKFGINYNKNMSLQNGMEPRLEQGEGFFKNMGVVSPVGMHQQQLQPQQMPQPQQQQPHPPQQQPLMTVHSTPILAPSLSSASRIPSHLNPRVYGHQVMSSTRGQPVGGTSPSSSTSSLATSTSSSSSSNIPKASYNSTPKGSNMFQQKATGKSGKPVSSVAPTNVVQKSTPRNFLPSTEKPSPIYQTSSTKILPVQPQTLGSTPQGVLREIKELSPPISASTPLGTPDSTEPRNKKPALPPKPAIPIKPSPPPPPRQAHPPECPEPMGYIEITPESLEQALAPKGSQKTDEVPLDSEPSRSPTPPPPPPPTTEPPDDFISKRPETLESTTKDDKIDIKKTKANQSSNLVNSNYSGTHINVNNINNNNSNVINNNNNVNNNHLQYQHNNNNNNNNTIHVSINRRIDIPPAFMIPETEAVPVELVQPPLNEGHDKYITGGKCSGKNTDAGGKTVDEIDRVVPNGNEPYLISNKGTDEKEKNPEADEVEVSKVKSNLDPQNKGSGGESVSQQIVRRVRKGNLKSANNKGNGSRRVSFDPLALLLDASLEGELELVMKTASQVSNPSAANDEGITALHNAICAGHLEIVKFLVEFGCDVNAQDSDGWTPLHCAASCNNLAMVRFLVEHGACIFATTLSDHETAAEKCEEDEEGFDGCSEYLYSIQEKLGILNNGVVYAVYDYSAHNNDELSFSEGDRLVILRKGDEMEREWWWSRLQDKEGYTPRNLLGLYPRVQPNTKTE